MATHPSTLPWKIPWTEELGRLRPQRVRHTQSMSLEEEMEKKNIFFFLYFMPNDRTSSTQHPDCVGKTLVIPLWVRDILSHNFQDLMLK